MMITNLNYYLKYEEGDKITDKELRFIKNVANVKLSIPLPLPLCWCIFFVKHEHQDYRIWRQLEIIFNLSIVCHTIKLHEDHKSL